MTREEQDLCRGLRAGSPKAYRQLLDRYTPYVWAVVRNIAGEKLSRAELEDLAAEVFAGIWRGREGLREEGSLRGYLAACARNHAPSSAQDPGASGSGSSSVQSPSDGEKTKTLEGTLNQADSDLGLLLVISDDQYCRFDLNGTDVSGLEPGDSIKVTYTGTLDPESDEVTAVVVSIEKTA